MWRDHIEIYSNRSIISCNKYTTCYKKWFIQHVETTTQSSWKSNRRNLEMLQIQTFLEREVIANSNSLSSPSLWKLSPLKSKTVTFECLTSFGHCLATTLTYWQRQETRSTRFAKSGPKYFNWKRPERGEQEER